MAQAWECPACHAVLHYSDYDPARLGKTFPCRKCGVELVVDKKTDQLVLAKKPS
jgi:transcription initiation factor IIE alpha subunit